MQVLNVGYENLVVASRVIAILQPNSSPAKRIREEAGKAGRLIDATQGRRTRSVVVLDSSHVVLSAVQPQTLSTRLINKGENSNSD